MTVESLDPLSPGLGWLAHHRGLLLGLNALASFSVSFVRTTATTIIVEDNRDTIVAVLVGVMMTW